MVKAPWEKAYGDVPLHLKYKEDTLYEIVEKKAEQFPKHIALRYFGKATLYAAMTERIKQCASALQSLGVRENDRVTIALPNCPQAVYLFYAVNLIGGVANMVHPLSAEKEIEFYLNESESVTAITLDTFYDKFEKIRGNTNLANLIVTSATDEASAAVKAAYRLTSGRKTKPIPKSAPIIRWGDFLRLGKAEPVKAVRQAQDPAVILYSGGTTGATKGVVLTNMNLNALGIQHASINHLLRNGDRALAAMPIFHGFGLANCIHIMLMYGLQVVLLPRFTPKSFTKQMLKYKCNIVIGVPTLFEALLRQPFLKKADLSFLNFVVSGGDSLSVELKTKFDAFLREHNATVQIREGYGTTETTAGGCLTFENKYRERSVGLPLPDMYVKIVEPGTDNEVPYGTEGEILVSGPTVMKEYLNRPEETAQALRVSPSDGLKWLYTGDIGRMDEDGYVYFVGRAKRMIVTSGYNVYPAQLENILDAHEKVQRSCIIGVPDPLKIQKVKAFVRLAEGVEPNDEVREEIMAYCRRNIAKYAMPYEIEFRDELPMTLIGKVAYRVLEEQEAAKSQAKESANV